MGEFARTIVILAVAGLAVSGVGSWALWWNEEARRLRRLVDRTLGGPADGFIVATGRNAAAGFRLSAEKMVVMSRGGADAVLYPLDKLEGAELMIDGAVAGRVFRGEPRRAVDKIDGAPTEVSLRLVFADARHPDFELELFHIEDLKRKRALVPAHAIREGRSWLARVEAIVRQGAVVQGRAEPKIPPPRPTLAEAPPWDEADEPEDADLP